jgi:hypothetical protein
MAITLLKETMPLHYLALSLGSEAGRGYRRPQKPKKRGEGQPEESISEGPETN